MTLPRSEREIRRELDKSFKPMFEQYDFQGGLPMQILFQLLRQSQLPRSHVRQFLTSSDLDHNGRITYDEFVQQMTRVDENTYRQITWTRRVLTRAVIAVAPEKVRKPRRTNVDETDAYNWGEMPVENYLDAYDCRPPPIFIPLISLALIGVYLYYALANPNLNVSWHEGVDLNSVLIWNPKRRLELWRYLSYMFLHSGYLHLIFNVVLQLVLGTLLELAHKFWRVGLVYMLGVVAGSLAHSVFDAKTYLAGASGGCYALLGAHFATIIINWEDMQRKWLSSPVKFFSSAVVRLVLILLMACSDTAVSVYARFWSENPSGAQIGFSAHMGGFVAGILVGVPILRNLEVKPWEKVLFWVCLSLYFLFIIAAFLVNYFCESYNYCYPLTLPQD